MSNYLILDERRGQLGKHLGLGNHGLARRITYTPADGLTYRRLEQQEASITGNRRQG